MNIQLHQQASGARAKTAATPPVPGRGHGGKILLLGLYGCGNYGNDGTLQAMLLFLRRRFPAAELTCVCVDPAAVERSHGLPGIRIDWPGFASPRLDALDRAAGKVARRLLNIVRTIRQVRGFDVLIVPGSGVLSDYRCDPFGAPYWLFRWIMAARLCGIPVCLVSTGAGPIEIPLSRWLLKQVARSAQYRSFRDAYSKQFVISLGIDAGADAVYPDIAFSLPAPRACPVPVDAASGTLTVGVGVMSYNGWQGQARTDTTIYRTYLAKLARFVCWLVEHGHQVRLLVGEITDEQPIADLRALVEHSLGRSATAAGITTAPTRNLDDLMGHLAKTDIAVVSRFHNIVCALMLARPTISISYTVKCDQLMGDVGLAAFCQQIESLDVDTLIRQFEDLAADRRARGDMLERRVDTFRQRLTEQEALLSSFLAPSLPAPSLPG